MIPRNQSELMKIMATALIVKVPISRDKKRNSMLIVTQERFSVLTPLSFMCLSGQERCLSAVSLLLAEAAM